MKLFADNIPIYLQIKAEVESAILSGSLIAEAAIDSIRVTAAKYSINPLTVSKAITELEKEGTIYKKRGIGFYVTPDARDNLRRRYMQTYLNEEVKGFVRKARELHLSLSELTKLVEENYRELDSRLHGNDDNVGAGLEPAQNQGKDKPYPYKDLSNPTHHPNDGASPQNPNEKEQDSCLRRNDYKEWIPDQVGNDNSNRGNDDIIDNEEDLNGK